MAATIALVGRHRDEAIEERNELRAEVAALRQDAERWRAVREEFGVVVSGFGSDAVNFPLLICRLDSCQMAGEGTVDVDHAADRLIQRKARAALSPSAPTSGGSNG